MGYSLFQSSTLGMMSQAHALDTIATNIANINTTGFKKTETRFATVLSANIRTGAGENSTVSFADQERAMGGVRPKDFQRISKQGTLTSSERDLDVAITGEGFFQVSPTLQVTGDILYTRDGSFNINVAGPTVPAVGDDGLAITVNQGYLADKNGFFVLGLTPQADGSFSATGAAAPMRVDPFTFSSQFLQTLTASLQVNLPGSSQFGDPNEVFPLQIVDSNGLRRTLNLSFAPTTTENQWRVLLSGDNLTSSSLTPGTAFSLATGGAGQPVLNIDPATRQISARVANLPTVNAPGVFLGLNVGDSITLAGSTAVPPNNGTFTISAISSDFSTLTLTTAPGGSGVELLTTAATLTSTASIGDPLVFNGDGTLATPGSFTVNLGWSDGASNAFSLDLSRTTQFNGEFTLFDVTQDGLVASRIRNVTFDTAGHVIGEFEDGSSRKIYKIPLAVFPNPDGMEMRNGNVFAQTPQSGAPRSVEADLSGVAELAPNTLEMANSTLPDEFTRMIQVQQAYNSSATVFKAVDEMTVVARDLKA